jgi:hypothetical protein
MRPRMTSSPANFASLWNCSNCRFGSISRNLCGGNKLAPEIEKAIEDARQVIVVLSPNTLNSTWVLREITKALEVGRRRKDEAAVLEVEGSQEEDAPSLGTQASAGELVAQASDWEFKLQLALPNHPQHRIPGRPIIPLIEQSAAASRHRTVRS